ncbi:hypothetical protein AB0I28_12340 [Phytomonospora sp. NPDC050363]|uniref:hypothetical protein n=1 Tax=Phytomonospora sp. NPDC050363 TaxID=3155642 RepID=UPI0033D4DEF3
MTTAIRILVLLPLAILSGAWTFMLTVGVLRGEWVHNLPTLGYWDSVLITATASAALFLKLLWGEISEAMDK